MDKNQLRGAIRMLESLIEIMDEEGLDAMPRTDLEDLLKTYKERLNPQP